MSWDDWAVGDLALCARAGRWLEAGVGPRPGEIHEVVQVYGLFEVDPIGFDNRNACFLAFAPWHPDNTFGSASFRKIRPHTPDAEDAETIRLLQGAPVREPAQ